MEAGRKVASVEEARRLLQRWERSGEAMSTWCRRHGINRYSLSAYKGWTRRGGLEFVEVELIEEVSEPVEEVVEPVGKPQSAFAQTEGSVYRIELGGELSIEVTDGFREDTLRRLIGVVASC